MKNFHKDDPTEFSGISNLTSVFLEDVEIAVLLGHVQGYT